MPTDCSNSFDYFTANASKRCLIPQALIGFFLATSSTGVASSSKPHGISKNSSALLFRLTLACDLTDGEEQRIESIELTRRCPLFLASLIWRRRWEAFGSCHLVPNMLRWGRRAFLILIILRGKASKGEKQRRKERLMVNYDEGIVSTKIETT
eukprot:g12129.t1